MENQFSVKRLYKSDLKKFVDIFPEATPKYFKYTVIYAIAVKQTFIGGLVVNLVDNSIDFAHVNDSHRGMEIEKQLIRKALFKFKYLTIDKFLNLLFFNTIKDSFVLEEGEYGKYRIKSLKIIRELNYDFFCKRHSCKMLKTSCLKRQKQALLPCNFLHGTWYKLSECNTCLDAAKDT